MGAADSKPPPARPAAPPAAPPAPQLPRLTDAAGDADATSALLAPDAIATLCRRLSLEQRQRWRRLFASAQHGQSSNRFLKHVLGKGPTLVVVRDTAGRVFGGYASESWTLGPRFHGGYACFLFSRSADGATHVHGASGDNANFMYFNQHCDELPNGVAFGGQKGYFGLWLHDGLDTGESTGACSTYDGAVFAERTRFDVAAIEVWATCEPEQPVGSEAAPEGESGTVLQRRRKDVEFLSMASNRAMVSDNL
jgi:hypothetical protein